MRLMSCVLKAFFLRKAKSKPALLLCLFYEYVRRINEKILKPLTYQLTLVIPLLCIDF